MCDYSLHQNRTRLAEEGEQLVVHRFAGGSLGLASPSELGAITVEANRVEKRSRWSIRPFIDWLIQASREPACPAAVCLPPGSRLLLQGIEPALQRQIGVGPEEFVNFDQLSAEVNTYRDCVRFPNGRAVLLQRLRPGQRVLVLALSPAPVEAVQEIAVRL